MNRTDQTELCLLMNLEKKIAVMNLRRATAMHNLIICATELNLILLHEKDVI
jgi:hypothetical protein